MVALLAAAAGPASSRVSASSPRQQSAQWVCVLSEVLVDAEHQDEPQQVPNVWQGQQYGGDQFRKSKDQASYEVAIPHADGTMNQQGRIVAQFQPPTATTLVPGDSFDLTVSIAAQIGKTDSNGITFGAWYSAVGLDFALVTKTGWDPGDLTRYPVAGGVLPDRVQSSASGTYHFTFDPDARPSIVVVEEWSGARGGYGQVTAYKYACSEGIGPSASPAAPSASAGQPTPAPSASVSGAALVVTSSSGSRTITPGSQVQVPGNGTVSLSTTCAEKCAMVKLWLEIWRTAAPEDLRLQQMIAILLLHDFHTSCQGVCKATTVLPRLALARRAAPDADVLTAAVDLPEYLSLELQQGSVAFRTSSDGLALDVRTPVALVSTDGLAEFDLEHDPATNATLVTAVAGQVHVQPTTGDAEPVTLAPGTRARVDVNGARDAGAQPGGAPFDMTLAVVAGAIGILVLAAIVVAALMWNRRRGQGAASA